MTDPAKVFALSYRELEAEVESLRAGGRQLDGVIRRLSDENERLREALEAMTVTDKGRALFEGPGTPAENPVRFRKCTVCAGTIDVTRDKGIEWTPGDDTFAHKACR